MSDEQFITGIREYQNEYFKLVKTYELPVQKLNPVKVVETLNTLNLIYKANSDVFKLGDRKIELSNFSFITDFCEGVEISSDFLVRPKKFSGPQDFNELKPSKSPLLFRQNNYAYYRSFAKDDEFSDILEQPLLYEENSPVTEGVTSQTAIQKKVSKFGNIGQFTTEASEGNSFNEEENLENTDIIEKLMYNRRDNIKVGDLRNVK